MNRFMKGQRVYRYYECEPAFVYGSGKYREEGVVLGDPVEFNGDLWVPVAWEYSPYGPDLDLESDIHPVDEKSRQ